MKEKKEKNTPYTLRVNKKKKQTSDDKVEEQKQKQKRNDDDNKEDKWSTRTVKSTNKGVN